VRRILALLAVLPTLAYGARPFVTDDTRIADPGSCQVESWAKGQNGGQEAWLLPACNPFGNLELSAGVGELRPVGAQPSRYVLLQAKTLFRELQPNGFGWGLAMGAVSRRDADGEGCRLSSVYAYFPFSASFRNDQWLVHANLGFQQEKVPRRTNPTWGVGTEVTISRDLSVIGETYGDNRRNPFWQAGLRYWLMPGKVQVDATRGGETSRGGNWFSVGIRLVGDGLF